MEVYKMENLNRFNFKAIKEATEKEELNEFLINEVFKEYKSKDQLKHTEFIQLLEANHEAYEVEEPDILNNITQYFTHELRIPEEEITRELSEELIQIEYDFKFNEMEYYKLYNLSYDIVLKKTPFTYFMEALADTDPDFNYNADTNELIITDLFNFLVNSAENAGVFFNSYTKQDLIESIAEEIQSKYTEINIIPEFEYYYLVYSAGKETYLKYNYLDELQKLNKQTAIIERELTAFLIYNESAETTFKEMYIPLTKALLKHEITEELINPIRDKIPSYNECKEVQELLKSY